MLNSTTFCEIILVKLKKQKKKQYFMLVVTCVEKKVEEVRG